MSVSYIFSNDSSVSVSIDGDYACIPGDHPNYPRICEMITSEKPFNIVELRKLCDLAKAIEDFTEGRITVKRDKVLWQGEEYHGVVKDTVLAMMRAGQKPTALLRFLDNLLENPSAECLDALFLWMKFGDIPITPEGNVLGYKAVRLNYTDHYSGKFKNTPGSHHKLRRNKVDDNRTKLCSFGFHVGTAQYARTFHPGNSKLILVEFNPRDTVSVHTDVRQEKIRVCEYKVVAEWDGINLEQPCYKVDDAEYKVTPNEPDSRTGWFDNDTKVHEGTDDGDVFDEDDYEWWEDDEAFDEHGLLKSDLSD